MKFQARWFTKPEAWILLTAVLAFVLKFDLALLTFGTNDVAIFYKFGRLLSQHGLQWIYLNNQYFNHPPLVGYYVRAIYDTAGAPPWEQGDISFPFLVRLPGIISDFVVVLIFLRLRKLWSLPTWSLIALALSPVSLMVSGFHGNTDPVMVMFLVVAAYMCVIKRPALCGIFLALSCQLKSSRCSSCPSLHASGFQIEKRAGFLDSSLPRRVCSGLSRSSLFPASCLDTYFSTAVTGDFGALPTGCGSAATRHLPR